MNNDADGYEIVQVIVRDKARDLERLNSRLELCNVKVTLLKSGGTRRWLIVSINFRHCLFY